MAKNSILVVGGGPKGFGYGEITPATEIAQKAAILTGLMGQFYIVVLTAVVVEKYIAHSTREKKD